MNAGQFDFNKNICIWLLIFSVPGKLQTTHKQLYYTSVNIGLFSWGR